MGKSPTAISRERVAEQFDVEAMRRKLNRAIELEEFEEAARIRDDIKKNSER